MEIRFAAAADVPRVLPMVAKECAFHERLDPAKYSFEPAIEKRYDRWLTARADDPQSVFLVADRGDALVGFLIGTVEAEIPIYRLKQFGFIHDLWVEEAYRNEGLARQMVMLAIERFREIGQKQIRLDTIVTNDPARKLLASCGFRDSTVEMLMELT